MLTNDDQEVGKITKQWSGLAREAFTDSDNFGINFPMDLDVRCKATLLAAVFLIVSFLYLLPASFLTSKTRRTITVLTKVTKRKRSVTL